MFHQIRSQLKQKGIKFKATDTKEMLLQALSAAEEDSFSVRSVPSLPVSMEVHETPTTSQSSGSNREDGTKKRGRPRKDKKKREEKSSNEEHWLVVNDREMKRSATKDQPLWSVKQVR